MPIIPVVSAPGIQRDGTLFAGKAYSDGEWCRFWPLGRPRKMAGYKQVSNDLTAIGRGMHVDTINSFSYIHVGHSDGLDRLQLDINTESATTVQDRTPAAFVANANNLWQFDSEFDVGTTANYLLAHAAPNMADIANDTSTVLYFGNTEGVAPLEPIVTGASAATVSGGVVVLHPYAVVFGSDGYLGWSDEGKPTIFSGGVSNGVRVTANKIVRGLPLRAGPGTAPAGLFWGLDTLSRLMYVGSGGGSTIFSYDTISTSSSILSAAGVIEHNGVYYWPTRGGFVMFNGVMQDIENTFNEQWFYKNINMEHAQKTFAIKVPLRKEIWWVFPKGASTEPNHAVILNYKRNFWYDTPLPEGGRSCGYFEQVFPYPLMTGVTTNRRGQYDLWQHEFGLDKIADGRTLAIKSKFKTNQISAIEPSEGKAGVNVSLSVQIIEPDFSQVGNMTMRVYGAPNATVKNPPQISADVPIKEPNDTGALDQLAPLDITERLLQFEFESNVAGGDYEMGNVLAQVEEGDGRFTSDTGAEE